MTFTWHGVELDYFDHPYNHTRRNERAVEIAVARHWLPDGGDGLEVGNVLSHYQDVTHRVVDRYEPGSEPLDLFDVTDTFDWVLSISTLEHVRWDPPEPIDAEGAYKAVHHLRSLLADSGRMLVTVPLGCNPRLDYAIRGDELGVTRDCVFARDGDGWTQHDRSVWKPYAQTTKWAEAVWIGEWS